MPIDDYVTLGRSGLRVSPFCLGAMTFGQPDWGSSVTDSERIMDAYLDRGGNFIDTANLYTRGRSEKIVGDHLGHDPRKRERLVLATKFFGSLFPGDPNAGGAGRKAIHAQLDESLRRLQTDYVDLYWMHAWDALTPIDETLRTLDDLVRAGKIRYLGFSDTPTDDQRRKLDYVSKPQLAFPAAFLEFVGRVAYGGTTIRGVSYPATPYAPKSDADRY